MRKNLQLLILCLLSLLAWTLLAHALCGVFQAKSLVGLFIAELWILTILDSLDVLLGIILCHAVHIKELLSLLDGLVFAWTFWNLTLGEANFLAMLGELDAIDWQNFRGFWGSIFAGFR